MSQSTLKPGSRECKMGKQESAVPFDVVLPCSQQSGSAITQRLQKHGFGHRKQRRHRQAWQTARRREPDRSAAGVRGAVRSRWNCRVWDGERQR